MKTKCMPVANKGKPRPPMVSFKELAAILQLSERQLCAHLVNKKGPKAVFRHVGGSWYDAGEVNSWVKSLRGQA